MATRTDGLRDPQAVLRDRAYWQQRFAGTWSPLTFPSMSARLAAGHQTLTVTLSRAGSAEVHARTRSDPVNIGAVMLVGVATLGLSYQRFEGAAAIRLRLADGDDWRADVPVLLKNSAGDVRDALRQAREDILEACEHASHSVDDVEVVAAEAGRGPVFDTEIVMRDERATVVPRRSRALLFECRIGEIITLALHADDTRYPLLYQQSILNNLASLIERIVARPHDPLTELSLSAPVEEQRVLTMGAGPRVSFTSDARLHEVLEARAREGGERGAVSAGATRWSYRELNGRANQLARRLVRAGIGRADHVAIMVRRGPEMLAAIYATLKAGAAYVPIDVAYPEARQRYILSDCGARAVIADGDKPALTTSGLPLVHPNDPGVAGLPDDDVRVPGDASDLAYLIYTSGSTGHPKGVMIEHRSVFNRIEWMQRRFPLESSHVILQKTPISFDVSVWELFWWAFAGASVSLLAPNGEKDPETLVRTIERDRVTHLHFVPSMLEPFLEHCEAGPAAESLRSLEVVFCSGEALVVHQCHAFARILGRRHGTRLVNLYGPTEATVDVTWHECETADERASVPIGRPIDNTQIYVVDARRRLLPIGAAGELCIAGVNVARGYYGQEELTAEKFGPLNERLTERVYRTGDLARWAADGTLEYLGRIDDQVKIRGYRIELGEIEAALRRCDSVEHACVVARSRGQAGAYLCAYVIAADGFDEARCRERLRAELPEYMVPAHIVRIPRFPLTPNGKLDRAALPDPLSASPGVATGEPATPLERTLAGIWREVLKVPHVGTTDNFFSLGGDSISFLSVLSKTRKAGLDVTFQQLFRQPTIAALARSLAACAAPLGASEDRPYQPLSLLSPSDRAKVPPDAEDAYPLSMLQAGLIFQSELLRGASWYHDIQSYTFSGRFHRDAFAAAVERLVAEHAIFRTGYRLVGFDTFTQVVYRRVPAPLFVEDWSAEPPARQAQLFAEFMARERAHRFEWSAPGLIRIHVQVLSPDCYRYNLSFHDSALDGWSINLLHVKLFTTYYGLLEGTLVAPAPPDDFVRRYVQAEREALQSPEATAYWTNVLEGFEMVTLPRLRGSAGGLPVIEYCDVAIARTLSDGVRALAARLLVPVKTVLLATHLRVLGMLTSRADVLTGYEHSGRPEDEHADQAIGLFLNTVPFGLRLLADEGWTDLIGRVYAAEAALLPYRRFPMAKMKESARRAGLLYETVFNFTHFHLLKALRRLPGLETLDVRIVAETEFPLRAEFSQHHLTDDVMLSLHYHANEFDRAHVERIGGYYVEALSHMVGDPAGSYAARSLIGAAEGGEISSFSMGPRRPMPPVTVAALLDVQWRARPGQVAVHSAAGDLTYAELEARTSRVSTDLGRVRLAAEAVVGVATARGIDWATAVVGILRAGAAYLPLDRDDPDERLRAMLYDAGGRAVICAPDDAARMERIVAGSGPEIAVITTAAGRSGGAPLDVPGARPEQLAYVLFTSGSTGRPKGAMIEHRGLLNHLYAKVEDLELTERDVIAQTAPATFDISIWQLLASLVTGGTTVIYQREEQLDPAAFVRRLTADGVTILELVPSYLAGLLDCLEAWPWPLPHLRRLLLTGEALKPHLLGRWFALYPSIPVVNAYGPTEASDDVTHHTMTAVPADGVVPVGTPVRNLQVHVLDARRLPVPIGSAGEIWIAGEGVGRGYVNAPERTADAFVVDEALAGWSLGRVYRTGDHGRWRPDGRLEYLGRVDEQVKIRGRRIELGEIENTLLAVEGVREAAAIADAEAAGPRLVAFVVGDLDPDAVRASLSERLAAHLVPGRLLRLDRLPLSRNGKVDKRALVEIARAVPSDPVRHEAPASEAERFVARLWAAVLGIPPESVGRASDFFDVGGNSLLAMAAALRSEGRFSIGEVFRYRRLSDLARRLEVERAADGGVLKLLSRGDPAGPAVVCFSYAGGNAVNFFSVAEAMSRDGSQVRLFGVEPPGHDGGDELLVDADNLAARCCDELAAQGIFRVVVWGHCSGAGPAVAFAARAARAGIEVRSLILAAKLLREPPVLRHQIAGTTAMSDAEVLSWLTSATGLVFEGPLPAPLVAQLGRTFRHDTISANRVLLRLWDAEPPLLDCPVVNVLAADDPLTKGDEVLHDNWRRASRTLRLEMVADGGHYLMKSRPEWIASFLGERVGAD